MVIGVITIRKFKMFFEMTLKWCQILDDDAFNPEQSQKYRKTIINDLRPHEKKTSQINVNFLCFKDRFHKYILKISFALYH
jgi:hypothetical protein